MILDPYLFKFYSSSQRKGGCLQSCLGFFFSTSWLMPNMNTNIVVLIPKSLIAYTLSHTHIIQTYCSDKLQVQDHL